MWSLSIAVFWSSMLVTVCKAGILHGRCQNSFCSVLNCQSSCFAVTFFCECCSLASFQHFSQGVSVGSPFLKDQPWLEVMQWSTSKQHPQVDIPAGSFATLAFWGCNQPCLLIPW